MKEDWIPISIDLARSAKLVRFACAGGVSRHEAAGLVMDFWCWTSEQSNDGFHVGLKIENLPQLIGGPIAFWQAASDGGWLIQEEGGIRVPDSDVVPWVTKSAKGRLKERARKRAYRSEHDETCPKIVPDLSQDCPKKTGPNREQNTENRRIPDQRESDRKEILFDEARSAEIVSHLAARLDHRQGECILLWKVSAMLLGRWLTEDDVADSVRGVQLSKSRKPLGYFRTCLAARVGGKAQLAAMLKAIRMPHGFNKGPPVLVGISGGLSDSLRITEGDE